MTTSALFPTYNRFNLSVAEAEGTTVIDTEGKSYLDFGSGIGVNNLGHRHPDVQKAVKKQLDQYWHVSNLYYNPIQEDVSQLITINSVGDYVFFCNSGAEANEAAIKLARKATGKTKILSFQQSFHGRTFATMSATGQDKIQSGFGPMLDEFVYLPFNNIDAVKENINKDTAAVMIEVIQGEGGVVPGELSFIKEVEQLCKKNDVLLVVDEIQTGIGRTGKAFGYQHYDISPDIFTLAKGLGNGLPVGAMVAKESLKNVFDAGSHGSTFGGNPLAMASAKAVLQNVFTDDFLKMVEEKGNYLLGKLNEKLESLPAVKNIRGKGLMIGIEYNSEVLPIVQTLMDQGVLVLNAGPNVLRLLPPLTVSNEEIDEVVNKIYEASVE